MYEGFLREQKESSANRGREGKKPTTREKLRNIFISSVHVLPGILPRRRVYFLSPILCEFFFSLSLHAHVTPIRDTPSSAFRNFIHPSRGIPRHFFARIKTACLRVNSRDRATMCLHARGGKQNIWQNSQRPEKLRRVARFN